VSGRAPERIPQRPQRGSPQPGWGAAAVAAATHAEIAAAFPLVVAGLVTVLIDAGQQRLTGLGDLTGMRQPSLRH
jgi:hypothetical protein